VLRERGALSAAEIGYVEDGPPGLTFAGAIARTLERGELLVRDLQASGVPLPEAAAWDALRDEWRERSAARATDAPAWEDLWRRVHQARRKIAFSNPLVHFGPLLFVEQVPSIFSHQLTQYYGSCARPGGGVFVLDQPGRSLKARRLASGALPAGSFQHPEVSCDGRRILFSYVHAETTPVNRQSNLDRFYHLYEMAADGTGLRQLTRALTTTSLHVTCLTAGSSSFRHGGEDSTGAARGRAPSTRWPLPRPTAQTHGQSPGMRPMSGTRWSGTTGASFIPAGTTLIATQCSTSSSGQLARTAPTRGFTTATTRSTQSGYGRRGQCRDQAASWLPPPRTTPW